VEREGKSKKEDGEEGNEICGVRLCEVIVYKYII
jgi:hypothetical protein